MALATYIENLELADSEEAGAQRRGPVETPAPPMVIPAELEAAVNAGSLLSFVEGLSGPEKEDVLYSVQFAQRAASKAFDRFAETRNWYRKYGEVLEALGWTTEQFAFVAKDQSEGDFRMDKEALSIISAISTQNQLAVITKSIEALSKLADGDGPLSIFDFQTSTEDAGNFQIGAVQKAANGSLNMALGAFYFRAAQRRRKFLFFSWGGAQVNFYTAAQKLTFNTTLYGQVREQVLTKLGAQASKYIGEISLD